MTVLKPKKLDSKIRKPNDKNFNQSIAPNHNLFVKKRKLWQIVLVEIILALFLTSFFLIFSLLMSQKDTVNRRIKTNNSSFNGFNEVGYKPVIYLYPQQAEHVIVNFNLVGKIDFLYPDFYKANSWEVQAYPDGHLINKADNKEYNYLFWEGRSDFYTDWSTGFVVSGSDIRTFLQNKLAAIGLTPKEYNEFIVYWYPKMSLNKYNLIYFAGEEYTSKAKLDITPKPDSELRVMMFWKPINERIQISEQRLPVFKRQGFTVVEWGGVEFK